MADKLAKLEERYAAARASVRASGKEVIAVSTKQMGGVMKRSTLFLCLLIIPCILVFAAAMPDFSGTWIRDVSKSDAMATLIGDKIAPVTADLVIKHADGKIDIESRWTHKAPTTKSYILNGAENGSSDDQGNSTAYVTSWEGEKLIIDEKIRANTPFGPAEIIKRSEWSLSDDGSTLTILQTSSGPFGSSRKQVYHR